MISFIKRYFKTFALIVTSSIVLMIAILFLLGYRFTASSDNVALNISSINTVASWVVPTMLSFTAIIISLRTAQHQNKIALFEKRHEVFTLLVLIDDIVKLNVQYLSDESDKTEENYLNLLQEIKDSLVLQGLPCNSLKLDAINPYIISKISEARMLFGNIDSGHLTMMLNIYCDDIAACAIKNTIGSEQIDRWNYYYKFFHHECIPKMRDVLYL